MGVVVPMLVRGRGLMPKSLAAALVTSGWSGTSFRRPAPKPKTTSFFGAGAAAGTQKRPLPVALIVACLVVVYVGIRYYWR